MLALGGWLLASCGGGGGGGLSGGPSADVNIDADPNHIDSGDRTTVYLEIANIREESIAIKIRYPVGLTYVAGSAYYIIDGDEFTTNPTNNDSDTTHEYLVFYLSQDGFPSGKGTLVITLEGTADVPDDVIEVDIDLDDPDEGNGTEFDVTDPQFDAQDDDSIRVGTSSASSSSSSSSGS